MTNLASRIIAIDPGVTGAIAYVARTNGGIPRSAHLIDLPTYTTNYGRLLDIRALEIQLDDWEFDFGANCVDILIFEEPFAVYSTPVTRNKPQLRTSAQTLRTSLVNFGRLQSVLEKFTGIYCWDTVAPGLWKKTLRLSKSKNESLQLARELFPSCSSELKRSKDHDKAEALLLAEYAHWHVFLPSMTQ